MVAAGHERAEWVDQAIIKERERIQHALSFLAPICDALKEVGDVIVIKSLDHWPDLGTTSIFTPMLNPPKLWPSCRSISKPSPMRVVGATAWPTNGIS